MTQALIRKAFETRLAAWASDNGVEVAWENVRYSPSPSITFVQACLLPARTNALFFDTTGRDYAGIFQATLHMPQGVGPSTAEAMVESLDLAFAAIYTQDGIEVTLTTPMSAAPALPAADRYVVPVSAEYRVVKV